MKRSRRVWLKLMGSIAAGAVSVGATPADARGRRHHAAGTKRKPNREAVSGGFGGAPRQIARFGDDDPSHGGS
ncbi:hypothetical protein [Bradyrhizobium ivorense]|nr:hypothetical protein [Bradyrhizobium ivorense]